ncbi:hypothetical protein ABT010_00825 [Streptomyces sp. NPDC002668]
MAGQVYSGLERCGEPAGRDSSGGGRLGFLDAAGVRSSIGIARTTR